VTDFGMTTPPDMAAAMTGTEAEAPDSDEDPGALAQALDATIDEARDALAEGNPAQADALLVAAEQTSDQLLAVLGEVDADEPNG
jgi:hypothetical protein